MPGGSFSKRSTRGPDPADLEACGACERFQQITMAKAMQQRMPKAMTVRRRTAERIMGATHFLTRTLAQR